MWLNQKSCKKVYSSITFTESLQEGSKHINEYTPKCNKV